VVELVKLFLNDANRTGVFKHRNYLSLSGGCHNWLEGLQPGEHLTGDDVLELLEFVTDKG
jgi:hypothetical protein